MMPAWRASIAFAWALLCVPVAAIAQDFPSRNVHIVVPLAAGSGMDVVTRIYAEELSKSLGKAVVVENQPGAALMLAAQNVARAVPDGHTLVVASSPVLAVNPTLYKKVNYEAEKDFVPLALYAQSPFVLITNPAFGAETVKDFIKKAQDSANPVTYATTGAGTLQFLTMEMLKRDHKFQAAHVAYRSPPQIATDIVGGHVASSFSETGAALTLIQDGKIRALGITASTRHPSLPQVPTMAEALGQPGFEAVSWHVLLSAGCHAAADRGAPARRHDQDHGGPRLPETRQRGRPDAARTALDRGYREVHQKRARPLERGGDPTWVGGDVVVEATPNHLRHPGPSARDPFACSRARRLDPGNKCRDGSSHVTPPSAAPSCGPPGPRCDHHASAVC